MSELLFSDKAFEDYLYWQTQDRKTLKKVNSLLQELRRDQFLGTGKAEILRGGAYSRRIDHKNRLVYEIQGTVVKITSCRGHYDDK